MDPIRRSSRVGFVGGSQEGGEGRGENTELACPSLDGLNIVLTFTTRQ